jgi:hypothetical protein
MGNSTSKKTKTPRRHSAPSARELEKYTQPTGYGSAQPAATASSSDPTLALLVCSLYPTCPWELKTARRLIVERKLAPRFPGKEAKEGCFTLECPICFMVTEREASVQHIHATDSAQLLPPVLPGQPQQLELLQQTHLLRVLPADTGAAEAHLVRHDTRLKAAASRADLCAVLCSCPFCNHEAFSVRYTPPSPAELASIRSAKVSKLFLPSGADMADFSSVLWRSKALTPPGYVLHCRA